MENEKICSRVILPCCPSYPEVRQVFNRSIQRFPSAIIYCENSETAARAVRCAKEKGQIIRVRSGGHNYEGWCVGDGRLTIDTSPMKDIRMDGSTLKIGGGINNRELYGFLKQYGLPFPSGTCPTVGAAGLTQGGGWGHSSRMLGLACDSLVQAELVDPGGRIITASETSHPDLFWALRGGGGGNLGVVTSLSYRLPPEFSHVTYVDIQYSGIDESTAFCFLKTWQEWTETDEFRFTPNSRIFNSQVEGMGIFLRGFFYGSPQEAWDAIRPFTSIRGAEATLRYVTFWEATEIDASIYPSSEKFQFAGRFAYGQYTDSQIRTIIQLVKNRAWGAVYASVALYALGGKVRLLRPRDTAFYYRNANFIIGIETVWRDDLAQCASCEWLYARYQCLHCLTKGSYINFPYINTFDYMNAYYGGNAGRLMDVKRRYDPDNLFCFPQSIRI